MTDPVSNNALPAVLILGAGAGLRMRGSDKLLEPLGGVPLLRVLADRARATGAGVWVTLPASGPAARARCAALQGAGVHRVPVPDAEEGMAASLRRGVGALPPSVPGVLVVLGDMPEIERADMAAMLGAFDAAGQPRIWRAATEDGEPGHPVLFHAAFFDELRALRGDRGARDLLRRHAGQIRAVTLPGGRARVDLDTPEAWAAWRRS
ncbi:nucleotidyltransferase family protein [Brevirhabdus sp.]|uniref:nucleotidyltransferase family protein n=1 Tax=Brevirhabdus sp. TaxID=2004514 RepID=UPI00405A1E59